LQIAREYAVQHPEIHVLENPKRLSSAGRNLAIKHSTGDYVVIVDGHCEIPTRRYYHAMVEAFERTGADCLGRPQPLDVTDATPLQWAIALARSSRLGHHPESFIYADKEQFVPAKSVAVAYHRDVFERVGLFDESMDAHEDGEFNYRCDQAGLRCYLVPEIAVRYFPRSSMRGLFRQMARYGRGRVRFSRKHPGTWGCGAFIPAVFVAYIAVGGAAACFFPVLLSWYLVGLGIYAVTCTAVSIKHARNKRHFPLMYRMPLVFAAVHVGAGFGIWLELLHRSERGTRVRHSSDNHLGRQACR
jgi:succinoglycan biosynthesis protein ExoA